MVIVLTISLLIMSDNRYIVAGVVGGTLQLEYAPRTKLGATVVLG